MGSAGYGLFFHNYRPSTFDVSASVKNRLQLKASGGEMDFNVFVGAMKEVLSQFTELAGRPDGHHLELPRRDGARRQETWEDSPEGHPQSRP